MKLILIVMIFTLFFFGCSKDDNSNPVNNETTARGFVRGNINGVSWYSNNIVTSKSENIRVVKGTQMITNDPMFTASVLELRIGVNQAGVFGIGEDEPGFQYAVKAYYTIVSRSGTEDENYKAYYENTSLLTINRISNTGLDAIFNFTARTDDSTKTVIVSSGVIQIDY